VLFITFEGLDGAGKSTQIERLVVRLHKLGKQVVSTREPGGTPLGDTLRELLLDNRNLGMAARTEALLYAASRAQLVHDVIQPALDAGQVVLCDRYVDASIAYQGAGLELGVEVISEMNQFATEGVLPSLTFLFQLPVVRSQERVRMGRQGNQPDRIEQRNTAYFSRVAEAFKGLAESQPQRFIVLDAEQQPERIEQEIWNHISNLL